MPYSSHFVWERLIGVARNILNDILLDSKLGNLTHDVLTTFIAEVTAIMNGRPLVPVSVVLVNQQFCLHKFFSHRRPMIFPSTFRILTFAICIIRSGLWSK